MSVRLGEAPGRKGRLMETPGMTNGLLDTAHRMDVVGFRPEARDRVARAAAISLDQMAPVF